MRIPSGVTDQYIYFVAVDGTDLKTREIGFSSFTVYRSRNGAAAAAMTAPTINETDNTNMPGVYELLLDEDMTIGAGNDTEEMVFHITHAGMEPVTRVIELYRPKITAGRTLGIEADGDLTKVNTLDGHTPQTADNNTKLNTLLTGTPMLKYMGYYGPGVYIDSGAANENTVTGTDGTIGNPVSTFAAARTIADAIGLNRYYFEGNSDITLGATHVDWEFCGVGAVADNILNFGSQDVSRSRFCNLTLEGVQAGAGRIEAIECALQDQAGAGATTLHIFALRCGIVDEIEIDTSNNNVFESCYSLVAGDMTPSIIATGAAGTLEIRHYSGGIELQTLSASHNVSIEGMGQVIFNADCNVNANVSIRGLFTITDNTAGMASLTQDAVVNMLKINAEMVDALTVDTHVLPGQGAPPATPTIVEALTWQHKQLRNKEEQDAIEYRLYDDAGTTVDTKAAISDDGTDFVKGELATGP